MELLVAAMVMILAFLGLFSSYLACLELNELSKNSSLAVRATKSRLEEIRNTLFSQIKLTYNNVTFPVSGLNGMGVSYIDDTDPNLLKVTVTVGWKQYSGMIVGEDKNLNGQLDAGEDKNGNGLLDSPTTMVSYVFQR